MCFTFLSVYRSSSVFVFFVSVWSSFVTFSCNTTWNTLYGPTIPLQSRTPENTKTIINSSIIKYVNFSFQNRSNIANFHSKTDETHSKTDQTNSKNDSYPKDGRRMDYDGRMTVIRWSCDENTSHSVMFYFLRVLNIKILQR